MLMEKQKTRMKLLGSNSYLKTALKKQRQSDQFNHALLMGDIELDSVLKSESF